MFLKNDNNIIAFIPRYMSGFTLPNKQNLEIEYNQKIKDYQTLITEVEQILLKNILKDQLKVTLLPSRPKLFDSFYSKIIRNKIDGDYFDKVDDIAGVRVVCTFFSDLEKIGDIIQKSFTIVKMKKRSFHERVDTSGYQSDHYIISLPKEEINNRDPLFDPNILNLKCEIQVRTVLMHAWASASHSVDYKQEIGLGDDFDKEMYALSTLFFFADQRFDYYKKIRDNIYVAEPISIENLQQEITAESLGKYLAKKFPYRPDSSFQSCIELTEQLRKFGYKSLQEVENIVRKASPALVEYEKENPPAMPLRKYNGVGAIRISVAIADTQNKDSENFYVKDILKYRKLIND